VGSGSQRSFVIRAKDDKEKAKRLCDEAELLVFGSAPLEYIENRIKENKLTVYYSERLFKNGFYRYFNPITISHVRKRFVLPSRNSNFYLICASSFAAYDFNRVGAFGGKMYKWGYQPAVHEKDIDSLLASKPADGLNFIWVGRLVKLKHCDDAIRVIAKLRDSGYGAHMKIVGTGDEENNLKNLVKELKLENNIEFMGRCLIDKTREMMDKANIFLFTSDFSEGWGATLNECMNSGVACVASHGAGSTNFLVDDGSDALLYKSGDVDMLAQKAKLLVSDKALRERIGRAAYEKMFNVWNPEKSCERFIHMIEQFERNGKCELYKSGPCSRALPLSRNWYKG
jgi:glycosyltransferase involved in cell wall biosynthesis